MNRPARRSPHGDYRAHAQALLFSKPRRTRIASITDLVDEVLTGIPTDLVYKVCKRYDIPEQRITAFMHVSMSTMKRRYREGRLTAPESDRFVHLTGLYAMAEAIFGRADLASQWMTTPNRSLAGAIPESYAVTDVGAREVEDLLGRIAHGIAA